MQITWYGHAAFLLEAETGAENDRLRIGLDPYRAPDIGAYLPINDTADVVAVSHENEKYHSFAQAFQGQDEKPLRLIDGLALLNAPQQQPLLIGDNLAITATRVWENDQRDEPIAMLGVTMDEVCVLHMGDCGHALTSEEIAACGKVDVLLALAGGAPTIALPDLVSFIRALKPRVVIPMHFGNAKINLNLRPVEELLLLLTDFPQRHINRSTVSILPETLPASTEMWVMPPAR